MNLMNYFIKTSQLIKIHLYSNITMYNTIKRVYLAKCINLKIVLVQNVLGSLISMNSTVFNFGNIHLLFHRSASCLLVNGK